MRAFLIYKIRKTSRNEDLSFGEGAIFDGYSQKTKRRIGRQTYCSFQEIGHLLWNSTGGKGPCSFQNSF